MSFGIPDDFKELVRDRTNIVDLVSETVQLQAARGGAEHMGLCPFHEDRNPSLRVYPDRNGGSYRCWVCQEGGDCYSWVMEIERVTFPEAIEFLAGRLGLEVPRQQGQPRQSTQNRQSSYDVLAWAEGEMHNYLRNAKEAEHVRKYLNDRGYDDEIIRKFRLGYHPNDWSWLINRAQNRFTNEQMLRVRVIGQHETRGYYDNFVDRVIFPIRDDRERPVAFGGRVLPGADDSKGKYWNSPDSDFFHKSNILYAFDHARQGIRRSGTALVVEGYTDCISCHQYGLNNVVATLGTALTEEHVKKIKRFGRRIVLVYDGDRAGQDAAEKAVARILAQEVDLRVMMLPEGEDPADLLSRAGTDVFNGFAEKAPEAIDFKFDRCVERHGLQSVDGRQQVRDEMLQLLAACPNLEGSDRYDIVIGKLSHKLMTEEWRIRNRLSELRQNANRRTHFEPADVPQPNPITLAPQEEREVIEILFVQPDQLALITAQIGADDFKNFQLRTLFERILDLNEEGSFDGSTSVLSSLDDNLPLKKLTVAIADSACDKNITALLSAEVFGDQLPFIDNVLNAIKRRRTQRQIELSKQQISQPGDLNSDTDDALRQLTQILLERMRHPKDFK